MKNSLLKTLIIIGIVTGAGFAVIACGSSSSIDGIVEDVVSSVADEFADEVQDALDEPNSTLTQELRERKLTILHLKHLNHKRHLTT